MKSCIEKKIETKINEIFTKIHVYSLGVKVIHNIRAYIYISYIF